MGSDRRTLTLVSETLWTDVAAPLDQPLSELMLSKFYFMLTQPNTQLCLPTVLLFTYLLWSLGCRCPWFGAWLCILVVVPLPGISFPVVKSGIPRWLLCRGPCARVASAPVPKGTAAAGFSPKPSCQFLQIKAVGVLCIFSDENTSSTFFKKGNIIC